MRVTVTVAILAVVLGVGLAIPAGAGTRHPDVALLAFAAPSELTAGERATVFGGLLLPRGSFEVGLWYCSGQDCHRESWLQMDGPGALWQPLGSFTASHGDGRVVLRVYDATSKREALVGQWSERVSVD